ncbi:YicC/YloC family endoribonuclease [Candidatus Dependentiae bacterium]
MLSSMTGFASKTVVISIAEEKINASISIKSLNSRFFEATCKLPRIVTHLETDIIKILKQKLIRGHIYLTMHMKSTALLTSSVKANMATVKSYLEAIDAMKKTFTLEGSVSINDIIILPGVFEVEEQEGDKSLDKQIMDIINNLIEHVKKSRQKEGIALKKDILKRIAIMRKEITSIEKGAEKLMERKKQEVATIIQKIETNEEEAADMRKSHLLVMLDKLDINEEIVRFKSHLDNLESHLESQREETGKKLDFTLQEMAREINTVAAKCSDAKISSKAINIKVELEKAREQAQNIV